MSTASSAKTEERLETDVKIPNALTLVLIIVGRVIRGLVGHAEFVLVARIFGVGGWLSNIFDRLAGISAHVQAVAPRARARNLDTVTSH